MFGTGEQGTKAGKEQEGARRMLDKLGRKVEQEVEEKWRLQNATRDNENMRTCEKQRPNWITSITSWRWRHKKRGETETKREGQETGGARRGPRCGRRVGDTYRQVEEEEKKGREGLKTRKQARGP